MNNNGSHRIAQVDYLILLLIIALAYYITYIPHQNYLYALHLDEWLAMGASKTMLADGNFAIGSSRFLEAGFHVFWGIFHQVSGISWMDIFRYFPGIAFIITILSVYVLARRQGFGLEAAFFTSLMPTTIGILGPAFLVPLTMALPFIPLGLFVAFNFRTVWSYVVLFIFLCFLLLTHATTAVGLVMVIVPYILLSLRGNFKHSLGMGLAIIIPFLVPFFWILDLVMTTVKSIFVQQALPTYVDYPRIIWLYGYLPLAFGLLGIFLLAMRGRKKDYTLVLGLLIILVMLMVMYTFNYGLHDMYGRGLTYMMLMMSVVAGAGLMGVRRFKLPARLTTWLRVSFIKENVGNILCLALIGLIIVMAIPARQNTRYYQMIDQQDYQAFVWIRDNIGDGYKKAIVDPQKGIPFMAVTEKEVYSAIKAYPKPSDKVASQFLRDGSSNTDFLRENGISIVYSREEINNPDLTEVRDNIYLLNE